MIRSPQYNYIRNGQDQHRIELFMISHNLYMGKFSRVPTFADTTPVITAMRKPNPIRRIGHHRIDLSKQRQYFPAIAKP